MCSLGLTVRPTADLSAKIGEGSDKNVGLNMIFWPACIYVYIGLYCGKNQTDRFGNSYLRASSPQSSVKICIFMESSVMIYDLQSSFRMTAMQVRYVIRLRILFHHGHYYFRNLELFSDTRYNLIYKFTGIN